jgi:hypothetical protein
LTDPAVIGNQPDSSHQGISGDDPVSKISYRGARNSTETVTQIALWRYHDRLGYDTIAERLNADPTKYPPPSPPGKTRARGARGKPSVYEISRNPKYTGCQVFNRRASRSGHGKVNEPMKWVWSAQPAHEPLIPNYTCWPKNNVPPAGFEPALPPPENGIPSNTCGALSG